MSDYEHVINTSSSGGTDRARRLWKFVALVGSSAFRRQHKTDTSLSCQIYHPDKNKDSAVKGWYETCEAITKYMNSRLNRA